jgi:hypothetical protein
LAGVGVYLVFYVVWAVAVVVCAADYAVVLAEGEAGMGQGDGYGGNIHNAFKWELLFWEFWGNSDFCWDLSIAGEFVGVGGVRESAELSYGGKFLG